MALNINGTTGISGVDGSVSAPALTGTDSNTGITFPSADTIKFSTGGVERMAITNSGISGITSGITMATQWRVTSDFTIGTGDGNYVIASNWESVDTQSYGRIGTDLTESSGVFTFPSTGIYRIFAHTTINNTSSASYRAQLGIHVTPDNSNYDVVAIAKFALPSPAEQSGFMNCEYFFDVTDTSTHKFRLVVRTYQDNIKFQGDTDKSRTSINVFRLGDT